jgi:hypothetical protein
MMSWSNEIVDIAKLSLSWVQDCHTPTPTKFISRWCLVFCEYRTTTIVVEEVSTMGTFWLPAKLHYFINEWTKKAHHNIYCVFFFVFLKISLSKSNDFLFAEI